MAGQKKKIGWGVELGGSCLDAITELIAIMRFGCTHTVEQQWRASRRRVER